MQLISDALFLFWVICFRLFDQTPSLACSVRPLARQFLSNKPSIAQHSKVKRCLLLRQSRSEGADLTECQVARLPPLLSADCAARASDKVERRVARTIHGDVLSAVAVIIAANRRVAAARAAARDSERSRG